MDPVPCPIPPAQLRFLQINAYPVLAASFTITPKYFLISLHTLKNPAAKQEEGNKKQRIL
jgi:hypothetical protein